MSNNKADRPGFTASPASQILITQCSKWVPERWVDESVDDLKRWDVHRNGWYGMGKAAVVPHNGINWMNISRATRLGLQHHPANQITISLVTEWRFWAQARMKWWDVYRMKWSEWYSGTERRCWIKWSFIQRYNSVPERGRAIQFARRWVQWFAELVLQYILQYFYTVSVPCFSSLLSQTSSREWM